MSDRSLYVLDASVGVKWFKKNEAGSSRAAELYLGAAAGDVDLVAPMHLAHEVLAVVQSRIVEKAVPEAWRDILASGLVLLPLSDELVDEAAKQCDLLGCSFYDALAPACASLFGATLATADRKAHGEFPDVLIIE